MRDLGNVLDTAKEEGRKEGLKEGIEKGRKEKSIEIAKRLLQSGVPDDVIAASIGLSIEEIKNLR